ncbi:alcohol dehydrogenase [Lentilactobacillus farraginis DSM 18382 = JCM 14108]|uniref:Alcohol dehydrogenase n=1 Tax=Lentilactobacillus farraginis DSM 18382 = JCM 14108 TaxID=1423743 RepID=X0QEY0_9LACO|nr:alcohol dehydrogenase [Lentilactobacillus farraginis DSM 18382 = JCM 14108]
MIENKVKELKTNKPEKTNVDEMINKLVSKAQKALEIMDSFDQEKVDHITHEMVMAGQDKHMDLAIMLRKKPAGELLKTKPLRICMQPKKFGTVFGS